MQELNNKIYFWEKLIDLEAREGLTEIYFSPEFDEYEFRKGLKKQIDELWPQEEKPTVIY